MERSVGDDDDNELARAGTVPFSSNAYSNISSSSSQLTLETETASRRPPAFTVDLSVDHKSNKGGNKSPPISDRSYMNDDDI